MAHEVWAAQRRGTDCGPMRADDLDLAAGAPRLAGVDQLLQRAPRAHLVHRQHDVRAVEVGIVGLEQQVDATKETVGVGREQTAPLLTWNISTGATRIWKCRLISLQTASLGSAKKSSSRLRIGPSRTTLCAMLLCLPVQVQSGIIVQYIKLTAQLIANPCRATTYPANTPQTWRPPQLALFPCRRQCVLRT